MPAKIWIDTDKSFLPLYSGLNRKPFNIIMDNAVLGELKYYDRNQFDVDAGSHTIALQGKRFNSDNILSCSCEAQEIHLSEGCSINLLCFADITGKRLYLTDRRNRCRASLLRKLVQPGKHRELIRAVALRLVNSRKTDVAQNGAETISEANISGKPQTTQEDSACIAKATENEVNKPFTDSEREHLLEEAESYIRMENNSSLPYLMRSLKIYNRIIANSDPCPNYFFMRAIVKTAITKIAYRNDLLDSAIEDMDTAIRLDPDNGHYYLTRGIFKWDRPRNKNLEYNQQVESIVSDYRTCISKNPTLTDAWLDLIAINLIYFDLDEAISLYGQCALYMATGEEQLIRSYLGCLALLLSGDPLEQVDTKCLYDRALVIHSLSIRETIISDFLGNIRNENSRLWPELSEIMRLFINHYTEEIFRGELFRRMRCFDEALNVYDEVLVSNPDCVPILITKSEVLILQERHDEVLELLERIIELDPSCANVWFNIAASLFDLGRSDAAIEAYDKVIKLNPNFGLAWHSKGKALRTLSRMEEARLCFLRAKELGYNTAKS